MSTRRRPRSWLTRTRRLAAGTWPQLSRLWCGSVVHVVSRTLYKSMDQQFSHFSRINLYLRYSHFSQIDRSSSSRANASRHHPRPALPPRQRPGRHTRRHPRAAGGGTHGDGNGRGHGTHDAGRAGGCEGIVGGVASCCGRTVPHRKCMFVCSRLYCLLLLFVSSLLGVSICINFYRFDVCVHCKAVGAAGLANDGVALTAIAELVRSKDAALKVKPISHTCAFL